MTDYVRGPASPPQSLGLHLRVVAGRNQIQKQIGNFSPLYFADGASIQSSYFELEDSKVWQSNPQETFQRLVIATSGVLLFEGVLPDRTRVTMPINKLLVLDTELLAFRLTNTSGVRVRGDLNFVSVQAQ